MADTDLAPIPVGIDPDGMERDRMAHIVSKDTAMRGYVLGEEITALCGKRFFATRDPSRYPVCKTCKELLAGRNEPSNP